MARRMFELYASGHYSLTDLRKTIRQEFGTDWLRAIWTGCWQAEESEIRASKQVLETARPERLLDAARSLELANKTHYLYVEQTHGEKTRQLRMGNGAPGGIRTPDPLLRRHWTLGCPLLDQHQLI
jgi:hypothetical protein